MGYILLPVFIVSITAGFFPSFVLARTPSISVLKGVLPALGTGKRLRRSLVVVQFTVAIMLVAGTFTVRQQLAFVSSASLGITDEEILVIDTSQDEEIQQSTLRIKQAFLSDPAVKSITASSDAPGSNHNSARTVIEDERGEMNFNSSKLYFVDEDFAPTFELEFVAGRNFSRDFPSDSTSAMIINERAAMVFAYETPEDAIGKRYQQWGTEGVIVGVFKDFNFTSLHDHIRPLSMRIDPSENRYLSLKLNTADLAVTMERLETIWSEQVPYRPLSYRFLDDRLDALYTAETRFSGLLSVFSFLAILIGCLGLFGLASLMTDQRSKEIGIRKALGASVHDIVTLLSRETTVLITVSFFVAAPLVGIYGSQWLNNFAYRIDLPWMTILLSGVMALAIAWLTIGHSSLSAARANPVDTLRSE